MISLQSKLELAVNDRFNVTHAEINSKVYSMQSNESAGDLQRQVDEVIPLQSDFELAVNELDAAYSLTNQKCMHCRHMRVQVICKGRLMK